MTRTSILMFLAAAAWLALMPLSACSGDGSGQDTVTLAIDVRDDFVWEGREARLRVLPPAGLAADDLQFAWSFGDGERADGVDVVHAWDFHGTYDLRVEAFEGERRVAEANMMIEVLQRADVAITTPTASPVNLTSEQRLQADTVIRNRGADTRVPVTVALYALAPSTAASLDVEDPDALDAALDAGTLIELALTDLDPLPELSGERAVRFSDIAFPADLPSGTWRLLVRADPSRAFADRDRSTTAALGSQTINFTNLALSGPALAVRSVSARPARTNLLNAVTFSATLANTGTDPALFLRWEAVLEGPDGLEVPLESGQISNLPARGEVDLIDVRAPLEEPISTVGQYTVRVTLSFTRDSTGQPASSVSPPITVTDDAVAGADIAAMELSLAPTTTFIGGTVELQATVANLGTDDVPTSFFCRTQLTQSATPQPSQDQTIDTFTVRTLEAGETTSVTRLAPITTLVTPGTWSAYLICDPGFRVPDSDRDNNLVRAQDSLLVNTDAEIDLQVRSLDVDRNVVEDGADVTYFVEVCNEGSNGATPTVLRIYQSLDSNFSRNDTIAATRNLAALEPGQCRQVEIETQARCDTFQSEYFLFAEADATELVPDINRANNVLMRQGVWTIEGAACVCEPDRFEPNNSPTAAAFLDPVSRTYTDLTMCEGNTDFYRVPLIEGQSIRAVITFPSARGNLDLAILSTDRSTVLARSETSRDREEASVFVVPRRGDYYIRVRGRTADDRNLYNLELSISAQTPGTDLTVFDVRLLPDTVLPGGTTEVRFDIVNLGDTPAGPHSTRLWLSRNSVLDPTEDTLLDEFTLSGVANRESRTRAVTIPADTAGGTWFILVEADARGEIEELDESNNIGVSRALQVDDSCVDLFEPNNSLGEASDVNLDGESPFRLEGLRSCSGNPDFYRICAGAGDTFSARVDFPQSAGDLDMRLYDSTGRILARSEGIGESETVSIDYVTSDTCYIVEVYTVGPDRDVTYDMTITVEPAPPELTCNTNAEPNGTIGTAQPLRDWLGQDLALCPAGDVDYYRVQLPANREVTFRLQPVDGETLPSTLRLSLWGPSQNFLTTTVSATEALRWTPAFAGNYSLRVQSAGTGARSQPYRITVSGLDGVDLMPVALTLNPSTATPGDAVRYTLEFLNGGAQGAPAFSIGFYLSSVPFVNDNAVLLRRVQTSPLGAFSDRSITGNVTLPPAFGEGQATWIVAVLDDLEEVTELDPSNNDISSPITLLEACLPDDAEPNGVFLDAVPLDDFLGAPLSLCAGESDWFVTQMTAGDTLRLTATFDDGAPDIDLFGFDSNLVERGTLEREGDSVTLVLQAQTSGSHYVEIVAFDAGLQTGYTLATP